MANAQNITFDFGSPGEFYVYLYRDPRPGKWLSPIYVGKGAGGRKDHHWLYGSQNLVLNRTLGKIRDCGLTPKIEIVYWCESEAEAFAIERELITQYGRRDLKQGTLLNRTDGGDGSTGALVSDETRRKLSDAFKKLWAEDSEYAKHLRALRNSKAYRGNMSLKKSGRLHSSETRAKMSAAHQRWYKENPELAAVRTARMHELKISPEVEAKRLAAMRKRWGCPLEKERFSVLMKKHWADPILGAKRRASLNKLAKISDAVVLEIRTRYANGSKARELAAEFAICEWYVHQLARGDKRADAGGPITPSLNSTK